MECCLENFLKEGGISKGISEGVSDSITCGFYERIPEQLKWGTSGITSNGNIKWILKGMYGRFH